MKKTLIVLVVMSLVVINPAYAENNPGKKLLRGVVNILTSPFEIPKQARAYWIEGAHKTDHILVWVASGLMWGIVQDIKRAGSGAWDILSFPFETPENYEPLLKPDYVFEEWPSDPDVFIFKKK